MLYAPPETIFGLYVSNTSFHPAIPHPATFIRPDAVLRDAFLDERRLQPAWVTSFNTKALILIDKTHAGGIMVKERIKANTQSTLEGDRAAATPG